MHGWGTIDLPANAPLRAFVRAGLGLESVGGVHGWLGRWPVARKVLIVDDEPNIVLSLEFLMKKAGFEVSVARNGAEAIEALEGEAPDLLLLDVMMPEFDGYEVCERIRADAGWASTKIVMLTARGRDSERDRGLALGADAYVTKPFSTRELVAQVEEMLAGK